MSFNIETKCVQSGYTPKNGEPRVVPIVQSTTYKYESSEQMGRLFDLQESGYFYTRLQNPTNDCVAAKIADLEGGVGAMLTSSGQAASFFSVFNICSAGVRDIRRNVQSFQRHDEKARHRFHFRSPRCDGGGAQRGIQR